MKHPVSAAATATFKSGWAFSLTFASLAGFCSAVTNQRGGIWTIVSDALGISALMLLASPVTFAFFFAAALIPAVIVYQAFARDGLANSLTAATICAASCAAATYFLLTLWPELAVGGAAAGAVGGVVYHREMARWLKPRPAPPS